MEFEFDIDNLFPPNVSIVSPDIVCGALKIAELHPDETFRNWTHFLDCNDHKQTTDWKENQTNLKQVLNEIGKASSRAQGFSYTITNAEFVMERNHRVYMLKGLSECSKPAIIGFLKIGEKDLYLTDAQNIGIVHELTLCVLDFYIVENMQRKGYGHTLFTQMLQVENLDPAQLAIDFPSHKFLSFLEKHFSLDRPKCHPNKFVTFPSFFEFLTGKQKEKNVTKSSLQNCVHEFIPVQDTNNTPIADTFKKLKIAESSWRTLGISPPHYGPEVCKKCGLENMNVSQTEM